MDKVDYVVPMVFPDDPVWRDDFERVCYPYPDGHVRFRSWGTEHTLIRLVKKNMPWVRTIHVLLACESQKQPWMDEEGVHVVYHRDFIPERFLPLFNSRSIEMFLKDIPGLADKFIYGNDDMFPLSPLEETDFFIGGKPCQSMTVHDFPVNPNNFHEACLNGLNFVASEFGITFTTTWLKNGHSIAPILKSSCEHLWKRGRDAIEDSVSPLRERKNFNQYIYSWYQHFSGQYVEKAPKQTYVGIRSGLTATLDAINDPDSGIVCINDHELCFNFEQFVSAVRKALANKL